MNQLPIVITSGEPAGIGSDLIVQLAQQGHDDAWVVIADSDLLQQRAKQLQLPLTLIPFDNKTPIRPCPAGHMMILHTPLPSPCQTGVPNPQHANYVLQMLELAIDGCLNKQFSAVVTCPVHKGNINRAGIPFSGHTEFFAEKTATKQVVMMLSNEQLRIALATTHIPLAEVATSINQKNLTTTLEILHQALRQQFGINNPHIAVCGLNPHAGEGGYLGTEEQTIITPVIEKLKQQGMQLTGPLSADTAFAIHKADAFLSMYHDQGLPVIKYAGFGNIVNVTLGLPIIRTSVDHGTALTLAGSGQSNTQSLRAAINMASQLATTSLTTQEDYA